MKVRELVELLKEVDQEAVVVIEGCDCEGVAGGLASDPEDGQVYIERQDMIEVRKKYELYRLEKKDPLEGVPYELRP